MIRPHPRRLTPRQIADRGGLGSLYVGLAVCLAWLCAPMHIPLIVFDAGLAAAVIGGLAHVSADLLRDE